MWIRGGLESSLALALEVPEALHHRQENEARASEMRGLGITGYFVDKLSCGWVVAGPVLWPFSNNSPSNYAELTGKVAGAIRRVGASNNAGTGWMHCQCVQIRSVIIGKKGWHNQTDVSVQRGIELFELQA